MSPSTTNTAEFEQTATSMLAFRRPDSFEQHRTTTAEEVMQIDMSATQSLVARKKLHMVIMFLITTLSGYIQVEYQSRTKSPFDDHATIMAAICVNLCLYAVSLLAEFKLQSEETYLAIIKTFGPLLGFLVLVLLLKILVPLLGIIASIVWAFFLLKAATTSYSMIMQCLYQVFSGTMQWLVSYQSHSSQEVHVNASSAVQSQIELNI